MGEVHVVFKYNNGLYKFFDYPPEQGGDDHVLGVWRTWDHPPKAWKIFKKFDLKDKITEWYQTAFQNGLPLGGMPAIYVGTYIDLGETFDVPGWALVVNWQLGSQFNFQGSKPFASALRDQQISHSRTSPQYLKILRACEVAASLPLNDSVHGAIDGDPSAPEPIVFYDINLGGDSGQAQGALDIIRQRGTDP